MLWFWLKLTQYTWCWSRQWFYCAKYSKIRDFWPSRQDCRLSPDGLSRDSARSNKTSPRGLRFFIPGCCIDTTLEAVLNSKDQRWVWSDYCSGQAIRGILASPVRWSKLICLIRGSNTAVKLVFGFRRFLESDCVTTVIWASLGSPLNRQYFADLFQWALFITRLDPLKSCCLLSFPQLATFSTRQHWA